MTEIFHMDNLDSRAQNVVYDVLHVALLHRKIERGCKIMS